MRFGFVLADMNTGSSLSLLPFITSMFPNDGENSLVVFPGGRLGNIYPDDISRNFIFNYANPVNLDGSIIWSSSLTGDADSEQVLLRFRDLTNLPMLTISGKTASFPDIPDISFDAKEGTSSLVRHFIEKHGVKKFAYIRGPENHGSSNDRFNAFMNTLEENGIKTDPRLYSNPYPWQSGELGMRQLLTERGLVPGKDFEALFCASDLILYHAVKELEKHGYTVPDDVLVCGFNDSIEARLLQEPVTTVKMPYSEMGRYAVNSLYRIVKGESVSDVVFPAYPAIRKTCGCQMEELRKFDDNSQLTDYISEVFALPWKDANAMVVKVGSKPTEKNMTDLLNVLCSKYADIYNILTAVCGFEGKNGRVIEQYCRNKLPEALEHTMYQNSYREREQFNALISFGKQLLVTDSVDDIARLLESNAPSFGFEKIKLHVFNREKDADERYRMDNIDSGVWVAAPLCTDTEEMGYLLMKPQVLNGYLAEEIRSTVSAAVKSVQLLEDTNKARQRAEKAEQTRINFFANVGENLRKPLSEINDYISSSGLDEPVKHLVLDRISGAEHTLDLVAGSLGEIELERSLVDPADILKTFDGYEGPQKLPCLSIDEYWFRQAVTMVVSKMLRVRIKVKMTIRGVQVSVFDKSGKWEEHDDSDILLAREIILLHGGTCSNSEGCFSFVLNYPTLSGSVPNTWRENDSLVCLGGVPPFEIEGAPVEEADIERIIQTKRLPAGSGAVFWSSEYNNYNVFSALLTISGSSYYRSVPFICLGNPRARSIEEAIYTAVKQGGRTILQLNNTADSFLRRLAGSEIISCDPGILPVMIAQKHPALVVVPADSLNVILSATGQSAQVPILVCADDIDLNLVHRLRDIPNIILANNCILDSEEFVMRVGSVLRGSEVLPPMTGSIVKRAQAYICMNGTSAISRGQIADAVNVSEDYLTRIFKREMGLSPWDYLNRYRINLASNLLQETGKSISEIASETGFKDQAYFCRVFRKVKGINPGKLRTTRKTVNQL